VRGLRIAQTAVLPPPEEAATPLLEEVGVEQEDPILPERLVLKNSFGFGGTNVSLVFAHLPDGDE
jgi:3-oxoacyl-(acyl-carrier-protein) synthase